MGQVQLKNAQAKIVLAKRQNDETKAQATFAATLHSAAEESNNRAEELKHSGSATRAHKLRQINATLRVQLRNVVSRQDGLQEQLAALGPNISDAMCVSSPSARVVAA